MQILFDVEKFDTPKSNLLLLDTFFAIRKEISKAIEPIIEKVKSNNIYIVVCLKPTETSIYFITQSSDLATEINDLLNEKVDLSKIAGELLAAENN